jgi:hypothetical protein
MTLTITAAVDHIVELSTDVRKMRNIVENTDVPHEIRYRAVVIEEGMLQLIRRYVDKIDELKFESIKTDGI